MKTSESLPAGTLIDRPDITPDELQLAVRNHSMPLEALRYPITPVGLHYLLTHFDIPYVDEAAWRQQWGEHLVIRRARSLEALPEIAHVDRPVHQLRRIRRVRERR